MSNIVGWKDVTSAVEESVGKKFTLRFVGDSRRVAFVGEPVTNGYASHVYINVVRLDTYEVNYLVVDHYTFKEIINYKKKYGFTEWSYMIELCDNDEFAISLVNKPLSDAELKKLSEVELIDLEKICDD